MSISPLPPSGSFLSNPAAVPPAEEVAPHPGYRDPDLEGFEEYGKTWQGTFLIWIPIETLMQSELISFCQDVSPKDKKGRSPLVGELYRILSSEDIQSGFKHLVLFIQDKLIPFLDPKNPTDLDYLHFLNALLKALKTGRKDLMLLPLASILNPEHVPNPHDLARAAVKSYYYLAHAIDRLFRSIDLNSDTFQTKTKQHLERSCEEELNRFHRETWEILQKNPILSTQRRKDLFYAFSKRLRAYTPESLEFINFFKHLNSSDLFHFYLEPLTAAPVLTICDEKIHACASFEFVEKNRAIYDDFIPRVEELTAWVAEKSKSLQKTFAFLQDFALFIQIGNLDQIKALPETHISSTQFSELLSKEIGTFKEQMKELDMAKKAVELFKSNPSVLKQRTLLAIFEQFYAHTHTLCQYALRQPLHACRQLSCHLPLPPPPSALLPATQKERKKTTELPKNRSQTTAHSPPEPDPLHIVPPAPLTGDTRSKPELSLMETLSFLRKELSCLSPSLMKVSKALGVKEALKNSQDHLEDLLSEAARFTRLLKHPLAKEQLFSAIVHFINQGTLLTEQLLTALLRKTHSFKDKKAMVEAVTHQLPLLLNRCHFGHFLLSQKARTAILKTNIGEILSRDLVALAEENPASPLSCAKGLLAAAYAWMRAEPAQPPDLLIHASLDYVADILFTCQELQLHLQTDDPEVGKIWMEEQKQTTQRIASFKRKLLKEAENISFSPHLRQTNAFSASLASMQAHFAHFLSDPALPLEIRRGFENLQYNYLCRLKTELHFHADLPPKELRLHYCHVLLLTQYIAEEFLYQLLALNDKEVDPAEIDHDLVQLVNKLGRGLKDFPKEVQDFLKSGKEIRALMRYRFSYQQNGPLQENIHNVSRLAETQAFEEKQDEQFTLVEGKKGSVQAMMKQVADHVFALEKLIHFLAVPA